MRLMQLHEYNEARHSSNKALIHYLSLPLRQAKLILPENSHPEFISGSLLC